MIDMVRYTTLMDAAREYSHNASPEIDAIKADEDSAEAAESIVAGWERDDPECWARIGHNILDDAEQATLRAMTVQHIESAINWRRVLFTPRGGD